MLWLDYTLGLMGVLGFFGILILIDDAIALLRRLDWRNSVFGKSLQDARNHARYRLRFSERRGR